MFHSKSHSPLVQILSPILSPTLSIVPPQLVFANQTVKADAPYIRMARDPVALILEKVTYGTKGIENKLYEDTGLTYLTSMEMRTADKYHSAKRFSVTKN